MDKIEIGAMDAVVDNMDSYADEIILDEERRQTDEDKVNNHDTNGKKNSDEEFPNSDLDKIQSKEVDSNVPDVTPTDKSMEDEIELLDLSMENSLVVDEDADKQKSKRSLLNNEVDKLTVKKSKVNGTSNEEPSQNEPDNLNGEASSARLTRSDLEEIRLQKIFESLLIRRERAQLYHTIRKHEEGLAVLDEEIRQLIDQHEDLVNLLAEFKTEIKKFEQPPVIIRQVSSEVIDLTDEVEDVATTSTQ
ncbi:unnamed protein product [Ceutorhynchus assimilis]|uniref:Uncharacterized protein n=1 Tax=Ceutorhynchus assimilis TaxID=467358 RepID=A0A9P0DH66_9CUCU|nr:unnamed protein product [Ceutorhynchus assimilis]